MAADDAGADRDTVSVGPVLSSGRIADAIVAAIRDQHPDVMVTDRGSYLRVLVPGRCRVTGAAISAALGSPFRLPGDLERVMPSFSGRFQVSAVEASWSAAGAPPGAAVPL